ncbi:hypothetical protein [Aliiroseovarius crassostreae]|uniref:hypothetical protein n=1 Tax=Aliiroseovarius crassostreae TaxID=154981 RepID=UPI00220CF1F7|nr:hypothetical protein [Aliiroseovarius crassostreae]UWP88159.1 hypothetical protein K3J57_09525 [Aliiroseovarius crassostreae]
MKKKTLTEYYTEYTEAREQIEFCGPPLSYRWLPHIESFDLHLSTGMDSFLWYDVARSHAIDLANAINLLSIHARNFEAWHLVLNGVNREETLRVHQEFLHGNTVVALNLPYSIKSRIYFALAHLSHRANRFSDLSTWSETELPKDIDIDQEIAAKLTKRWGWRKIAKNLEQCDGQTYRAATMNFRNKYTHRHELLIGVEMAAPVERICDGTGERATYTFGGTNTLELSKTSDLLKREFSVFSEAYKSFQAIVNKQMDLVFPTCDE